MSEKLKIGIVDDHPIFRKGLISLINQIEDVQVVFEASNGLEFINFISIEDVDIVFMDIQMPVVNGIDATRKALAINKSIKVIALSMYADQDYFEDMIQAGACGFLLKDAVSNEIEDAIRNVRKNVNYFSEEMISFFTLKFVSDFLNDIDKGEDYSSLSENELNSIKEICNSIAKKDVTHAFYMTMAIKGMKKSRKRTYSLPAIATRRIMEDWDMQRKPFKYN